MDKILLILKTTPRAILATLVFPITAMTSIPRVLRSWRNSEIRSLSLLTLSRFFKKKEVPFEAKTREKKLRLQKETFDKLSEKSAYNQGKIPLIPFNPGKILTKEEAHQKMARLLRPYSLTPRLWSNLNIYYLSWIIMPFIVLKTHPNTIGYEEAFFYNALGTLVLVAFSIYEEAFESIEGTILTPKGTTPLFFVMCEPLTFIRQRFEVNLTNAFGDTALHFAVQDNNLKKVQSLLKHRADPFLKNGNGKRVLDLAMAKKDNIPVKDNTALLESLLQAMETELKILQEGNPFEFPFLEATIDDCKRFLNVKREPAPEVLIPAHLNLIPTLDLRSSFNADSVDPATLDLLASGDLDFEIAPSGVTSAQTTVLVFKREPISKTDQKNMVQAVKESLGSEKRKKTK